MIRGAHKVLREHTSLEKKKEESEHERNNNNNRNGERNE